MDKHIQERIAKLKKSLYKNIQKASKKDVINDVLDSNNIAEISPDSISPDKSSVVKKNKDEECKCEKKSECECEEAAPLEKPGMHKSEQIAREILDNFKTISEVYLRKGGLFGEEYNKKDGTQMIPNKQKLEIKNKADEDKHKKELFNQWQEDSSEFDKNSNVSKSEVMAKAKVDQYEKDAEGRAQARKERGNPPPKSGVTSDDPRAFKPHKKEKGIGGRSKRKLVDEPKAREAYQKKLKAKKKPKEEQTETYQEEKMAASEGDNKDRCWEGYEPTPGKKPYSEGSCQKKSEKPFHGYNKEKHSKEGGLSEKERNKINREEGSNLKAPVSSEEAKKSPKKAARRKSFCARMSGNKGPTSKDGKLTPKGAALKRWDC
jgi:hypothetical protein